ncbi:hypothetical protein DPMN_120964 [Dreissena polymorpha]|uniref:C2H2-type domain-containing protein n=1 Tax=Dreissena polymorpha TaxID=45954 RepID=A0A9D4JP22_DREPO|nr:hypothetical protein DPMN_120964 [Dreissena polymorpha]
MQLHSGSTYVCDFPGCRKTFNCKNSLQRHTRSHTDSSKVCCQCGKVFTTTNWQNTHENELHLGKASKYSFKLCAKPCQPRYALQLHLSTHSDEKYTPVKHVRSRTKPHQFFECTNAFRTTEKESMPVQHAPKRSRQEGC